MGAGAGSLVLIEGPTSHKWERAQVLGLEATWLLQRCLQVNRHTSAACSQAMLGKRG